MFVSRLFKGALAGCAATLAMTLAMAAMAWFRPQRERSVFPPYKVTARIASRIGLWQRTSKREHAVLALFAHFGYGVAAGALYAPLALRLRFPALLSGIAYGIVVWAAGYMGWLPTLGIVRPPPQQPGSQHVQLIVSHLIWGAVLGLTVDQFT